MAVLLSSCARKDAGNLNSAETTEGIPNDTSSVITSTDNDTSHNKTTEYTIYFGSAEGDNIQLSFDDIKLETANSKIFWFAGQTQVEKSKETADSCSISIGNNHYDLEYSRSYRTDLYKSEKLKSFSEFVAYENDDALVEYRSGTDMLSMFTNYDREARIADGSLTENEAQTLAKTHLIALYGDDIFNEYDDVSVFFSENSIQKGYAVVYTKNVYGIPTNDNLQIFLNMKGEVISVNAKNIGIYDDAEESLSKEQIYSAISTLSSSLGKDYNVLTTTLIVDSLGDYYIYAQATVQKGSERIPVEFYINVA